MPALIPEKSVSRELFRRPLVCSARAAQLRATLKIRLCLSQRSGYSEILRGPVKPVQLRFPGGLLPRTAWPVRSWALFNGFPNIAARRK